jgi:hypothetical protein
MVTDTGKEKEGKRHERREKIKDRVGEAQGYAPYFYGSILLWSI